MYLLNVSSLALESFLEDAAPPYAILSHTWEQNAEVSFQDIQNLDSAKKKKGFAKILSTAKKAEDDGLDFVWIDTCCIEKSSSSELQEAINSMFRWYARANVCYVYLSDVSGRPSDTSLDKWIESVISGDYLTNTLAKAVWMSRGWCLQELIAPEHVKFYAQDWSYLGEKSEMLDQISAITNIDVSILDHTSPLSSVSIAKRMSWAANRRTSRVEDQAYCLLGIFEVSMPMLYGEGTRAFIRLQEEIVRTSNDQSIFAWGVSAASGEVRNKTLLAESPADFASCYNITIWGRPGSHEMTNRGLRITLPLLRIPKQGPVDSRSEDLDYLGILNCRFSDDLRGTLALRLTKEANSDVFNVAFRGNESAVGTETAESVLFTRLAFVNAPRLAAATPSQVEVAREIRQQESQIKIWLRLQQEAGYSQICPVTISEHFPGHLWKSQAGIMYPIESDHVYAGVTLHSQRADMPLTLVFGYDRVSSPVQAPGMITPSRLVPFIGGWQHEKNRKSRLRPCTHHQGTCQYFSLPECPVTPSVAKLESIPDLEDIFASIRLEGIMDEIVCVVDVNISGRFELETIEQRIELDATPLSPRRDSMLVAKPDYLTHALSDLRHRENLDDSMPMPRDSVISEPVSPQSTVHSSSSVGSPVSPSITATVVEDTFIMRPLPAADVSQFRMTGPLNDSIDEFET